MITGSMAATLLEDATKPKSLSRSVQRVLFRSSCAMRSGQ